MTRRGFGEVFRDTRGATTEPVMILWSEPGRNSMVLGLESGVIWYQNISDWTVVE